MSGRRRIVPRALLLVSLFSSASAATAASLLPLTTQDARTLPNGKAEAILSIAYFDGLWFPPFTQPGQVCCQSLLAAPSIAFHIGLGSRVEVQASYEALLLEETQLGRGSVSNYGSGDARLFTKVLIFREQEWIPALGVRFGAKLPNASAKEHLGTDRVDWGGDVLASKLLGPVDLHANLGLQLLDNPGPTGGQDDLFSYAVGAASPDLASLGDAFAVRLLGELNGLAGSRFGNDRSAFRGGFQIRGAALSFFGGVSAGLIRESENIGGIAGVIWTFQTFGD